MRQHEVRSAAAGQAEARRKSVATALKAAEIEAAISKAQEEAAAALIRKRAEADARMAEREAEAKKNRLSLAKKEEEVRLAMLKKQEEIQDRAAKEVAAAAEQRLLQNERKEAELQARMLAEKQAMQKKIAEKAAESAFKVERSAKLRKQHIEEQRQEFARRSALMEKRTRERAAAEDRRLHEQREKQATKKVQLQKAKDHMLENVEAKKQAIINEEQRKELSLQRRALEVEEQRRMRQHERCMMLAAQKQRTEESMTQLQGRLEKLDCMVMARMERAELLERAKEAQIEQQRQMSRSASLSRHAMSNTLRKIEQNLSNRDLTLRIPANVRRNLEKPELRSLFETCDPKGEGVISVKSVRNLLAEARASVSSSAFGQPQPNKLRSTDMSQKRLLFSYSTAKLLAPAKGGGTGTDEMLDTLLRAFNMVDAEGTGSIAKSDLYAVLEKAGMTQPGPNAMSSSVFLRTFEGFNSNEDARISLDDFVPFAAALAKKEFAS
mmetsp:Transcript_22409/g.72418  ORF Transcript_22409/g.72418 Transcript_22409/m.72418 type:complete len:496 (+) Transcript_22409:164-1651(+)